MNYERSGKYRQISERRHSLFLGIVVKKAHRKVNSRNHLLKNIAEEVILLNNDLVVLVIVVGMAWFNFESLV